MPSDAEAWNAIQAGRVVPCCSETLGETVLWVRDEAVKTRAQAERPGAVIYTVEELNEIIRSRCGAESLARLHTAKKILGGAFRPEGAEAKVRPGTACQVKTKNRFSEKI